MGVDAEAIVAIIAVIVAVPPTVLVLFRWVQRRRWRRDRAMREYLSRLDT